MVILFVSIILTALITLSVTIFLYSDGLAPNLQEFIYSFDYIKFLIQVLGVGLGFLYFYNNQSNQKRIQKISLLQKKIDEGNRYLDELEALYIKSAKMDLNNGNMTEINLSGEKIFKFIESHREIFQFTHDDLENFIYLYSISSDKDFSRAFEKNRIYTLLSTSRTIFWSRLN